MSEEKVVYKYDIEIKDSQLIDIPAGGEILTVQTQHGRPRIWVLVQPEAELKQRVLLLCGTGQEIEVGRMKYIGTFQMYEGKLVYHLFEVL